MDDAARDALLTLTLTAGLGPTLTRRCVERFGSAEATLGAQQRELAQVEGIGPQGAAAIHQSMNEVVGNGALEQEKELIEQHGAHVVMLDDPAYPGLLRHIPDPPPLLYVRGEWLAEDALALGVVGARKCSHYGREQADRLAGLCAASGLCIISGGAYGIDAAAHRAAMRSGGRTIAVLGSGLARPYPTSHIELFDEIADGHGAVISELPMTSPPAAQNFPRRNRIISGLSLGVLVVEAATRSGALITARLAAEDHGREVMAVPGRIDSQTSAGCHKIIREGWATLVTSVADVLDALGETGSLLKAGLDKPEDIEGKYSRPRSAATAANDDATPSLFALNLTDSQRRITDGLDEPRSLDELLRITNLPASTLQADLTMLQIRGVVERKMGVYHRRKGSAPSVPIIMGTANLPEEPLEK